MVKVSYCSFNSFFNLLSNYLFRVFYGVIGGPKRKFKLIILNECLSLCARRWFNKTKQKADPNDRVALAPKSFDQYMKRLFAHFADMDIKYKYYSDFNTKGHFHAILKLTWREGKSFVMCVLLYLLLLIMPHSL